MNALNVAELEDINSSHITAIGGGSFYCYNETSNSAKSVGTYSYENLTNVNHVQVRLQYDASDTSEYTLNYTRNGESGSHTFTPENRIKSFTCDTTSFSCQLLAPVNGGNANTFCSINLLNVQS